jgi:hypothetical protein
MTYMILDSTGSAVASFDDETAARATLRAICQYEPDAVDHVVMIAYDDDGMPVDEAITFDDLPPAVIIQQSHCMQVSHSAAFRQLNPRVWNRYVSVAGWGTRIDAAHDRDDIAAAHG